MNEAEKKRLEELEELERKVKKRYKYVNEYQKETYDRITVLLPKGRKKELDGKARSKGFKSVTDYIKALIDQDASTTAATLPGAKEPESFRDPNEGASWESEPLPFG